MQAFSADTLYGSHPRVQPNATAAVTHPAGTPEPFARSEPNASQGGLAANPVFVLVALLGVAVLVMHLSIVGEVKVSA